MGPQLLLPKSIERNVDKSSSTFVSNMSLPVHRWVRYSAGFSSAWVENVLRDQTERKIISLLDPFVGSGTTAVCGEKMGVASWGLESHPFVFRIAKAKLCWHSNKEKYILKIAKWKKLAAELEPNLNGYPKLISDCYSPDTLGGLDQLRRAYEVIGDDTPESQLAWLTLVSILRPVSRAGTAQWQYILPKKSKRFPLSVETALERAVAMISQDLALPNTFGGPKAILLNSDARTCGGVPSNSINLVITSPPYPNNYDYADATRLEMSFFGEVKGWGDLQTKVRRYLIRSCSQHVPEAAVNLEEVLSDPNLQPIVKELSEVCYKLSEIRKTKGGKKTYHLMVACYFRDLAMVWKSLRRVCSSDAEVYFVIGDSAPYGIYVPVIPWLGRLALSAGFRSFNFEKTRDRNIKWKNRKHRVPLQEGRLFVKG